MFSSVPLNVSECTPLLVRSWLVSEKSCESSPLLALTTPDVPARCSTASPHAVTSPAVIVIGRMARRRRPGLRGADIVGSVVARTADAVRSSSSHAEGSGRRSIRYSFSALAPEYDRPVPAGLYQTPSEPLGRCFDRIVAPFEVHPGDAWCSLRAGIPTRSHEVV